MTVVIEGIDAAYARNRNRPRLHWRAKQTKGRLSHVLDGIGQQQYGGRVDSLFAGSLIWLIEVLEPLVKLPRDVVGRAMVWDGLLTDGEESYWLVLSWATPWDTWRDTELAIRRQHKTVKDLAEGGTVSLRRLSALAQFLAPYAEFLDRLAEF